MDTRPRILVLNPNTGAPTTQTLAELARRRAPDATFVPSTGRFGAAYVSSRAAYAIAGHAALDAYARDGAGCDAVLLACFGDPGLDALAEIAPVPVIGMAAASCHVATLLGPRFGIVTGGARWPAMLEGYVASLGLSARLAGVRAVAPTGDEIARDPDAALAILVAAARACADEDGADVVVLAGAGLAGVADRIAPSVPVPVLCSFAAALETTLAVARLAPRAAERGAFAATPPVATSGLSAELAALFAGPRAR